MSTDNEIINPEKDSSVKICGLLKEYAKDLKLAVNEIKRDPGTYIDQIQIDLLRRQYSYIAVLEFIMHFYYLVGDIMEQKVRYYALNFMIISSCLVIICNSWKIKENYTRVVMGMMLMISPVVQIERCLSSDFLIQSYSLGLVFITSEILILAILLNQRFVWKLILTISTNVYLFFRVYSIDTISNDDAIMFFAVTSLYLLFHGTQIGCLRKYLHEFIDKDSIRDILVRDTTLLMKVIVSSPVYIVQIPNFYKLATFFANRPIGEVGDEDRNFLKQCILDGELKYFDPDDQIMTQVSLSGLFKFIEELYFDVGSDIEISKDVFTVSDLDNLQQELPSESSFTSNNIGHGELPNEVRDMIFTEEMAHFMDQNVSYIFMFIYKLFIDYKVSGRGYKVSLKDVNNKMYLDEDSSLKYYDLEMTFIMYQDVHSIIISLKDAKGRYQVKNLKLENENKEAFLASIVHDMRAPLHVINGYSDHIEEVLAKDDPQNIKSQVKTIRSNGEHLGVLVNDILDSTRIKKGKLNIESKKFDIRHLVLDCIDIIEEMIKSKGPNLIKIVAECDSIKVNTDYHRLKRVLLNLLTNSIKFTTKGTISIKIKLVGDGTLLRILVSDTGAGMTETTKNNLFKAFNSYKDQTGALNKDGIGLGLAISLAIVQRLGPENEITVDSVLGKGSTFKFSIFRNFNTKSARPSTPFNKKRLGNQKTVHHEILNKENLHENFKPFKEFYKLTPVNGNGNSKSDIHNTFYKKNSSSPYNKKTKLKSYSTYNPSAPIRKLHSNFIADNRSMLSASQSKVQNSYKDRLLTEERGLIEESHESIGVPVTQCKKAIKKIKSIIKVDGQEQQTYHLLILDDQKFNADLVKLQINRFIKSEGIEDSIQIQTSITYSDAVRIVMEGVQRNMIFSLILTDFNLDQDYTGQQFVRKVKQVYRQHGVPVPTCFLISGEEMETCEEFDQVLQKAYQYKRFKALMKQWYDDQISKQQDIDNLLPSVSLDNSKVQNSGNKLIHMYENKGNVLNPKRKLKDTDDQSEDLERSLVSSHIGGVEKKADPLTTSEINNENSPYRKNAEYVPGFGFHVFKETASKDDNV